MGFEWDPWKAVANFRKHGVRFPEAEPVFLDDYSITITDEESDVDEVRFVSIGADAKNRILVVVYCYRDAAIRIISARSLTKTNASFTRTTDERVLRLQQR